MLSQEICQTSHTSLMLLLFGFSILFPNKVSLPESPSTLLPVVPWAAMRGLDGWIALIGVDVSDLLTPFEGFQLILLVLHFVMLKALNVKGRNILVTLQNVPTNVDNLKCI